MYLDKMAKEISGTKNIDILFVSDTPNQSLQATIEREFLCWLNSTTLSWIEKGYSLFL